MAGHPGSLAIHGNAIWVGDWLTPEVVRVSAFGSPRLQRISLPGADYADNVWCVAVGAGAVWATTPGATAADAALLADELDYVIGVDTHRDQHVLAVVTAPAGAVVARRAIGANGRG